MAPYGLTSHTIQSQVDRLSISGGSNAHTAFRIGVHYGKVLASKDGFTGEGVNIAVRLTELSSADCICLSGQVLQALELPDNEGLQFLGNHELKNVARPVSVYSARRVPFLKRLFLKTESLVPRRFRQTAVTAAAILVAGESGSRETG